MITNRSQSHLWAKLTNTVLSDHGGQLIYITDHSLTNEKQTTKDFFEYSSMLSDVYNLEKCNADQCKTMGRPYYLISTQTILNTTLLFTSFCNIKTLAFNGLGRRELG